MSICIKVFGHGETDQDGKVRYTYLFSEDGSERDGMLLGSIIAPDGTKINGDVSMIFLPNMKSGTHLVSAVSFAKRERYGLKWEAAD